MKKETVRAEFDALRKEKKTQKEAVAILAEKYSIQRSSVTVHLRDYSKYKKQKRSKNSLTLYLPTVDEIVKESKDWDEVCTKLKDIIPFEVSKSTLCSIYYQAGYKANFPRGGHRDRVNKWLKSYDSIVIEEVSKNPGNLRESFRVSTKKINDISEKKYSVGTIESKWYKYLNHKQEVFKVISKHQTLTNIKNKTPHSKIRGVRKVVKTLKVVFKNIFS